MPCQNELANPGGDADFWFDSTGNSSPGTSANHLGSSGHPQDAAEKDMEPKRKNISEEQRQEILRRHQAGQSVTEILGHVGFTRQSILNVLQSILDPERARAKLEASYIKKLTRQETEEFTKILKDTTPMENECPIGPREWGVESAVWLANKRFGKKPSVASVKQILGLLPRKPLPQQVADPRPEPPEPFDIMKTDPELAKDKDFVKYCSSPIARQIAWRSYECALKEWEERNAGKTTAAPKLEKEKLPASHSHVGKRLGKHAGSRNPPFTKKKKKRKK